MERKGVLELCEGVVCCFFFFKQKTAYEIGTGDWSSDVCSSDLWDSRNISALRETSYRLRLLHHAIMQELTAKFHTTLSDLESEH